MYVVSVAEWTCPDWSCSSIGNRAVSRWKIFASSMKQFSFFSKMFILAHKLLTIFSNLQIYLLWFIYYSCHNVNEALIMRTTSCRNRNYTPKGKAANSNSQKEKKIDSKNQNDSKPQPTLQNAAYKMKISNTNKWYELLIIHYYEHLKLHTTYLAAAP